jgi:hypothetical protein
VWLYQLLQLYFHILLPCIVAISFWSDSIFGCR